MYFSYSFETSEKNPLFELLLVADLSNRGIHKSSNKIRKVVGNSSWEEVMQSGTRIFSCVVENVQRFSELKLIYM